MTTKGSDNAFGIRTDKTLIICHVSASWKNRKDDEALYREAKRVIQEIEAYAKELGAYSRFKYLNYSSAEQDPSAGYGEGKRQMLRGVSRKYDPHELFQKSCVGGFKL